MPKQWSVEAWAERLRQAFDAVSAANGLPLIREVRGAAALAAAAELPERLAANTVFVAPASADARAGGDGGPQVATRSMLVVIALRDPRDDLGADGLTDLEAAVKAVECALVGWRPPGASAPASFVRGALHELRAETIWWQMTFRAPVFVRGGL